MLQALKSGQAVWYAVDQDYGLKHSVFSPFFGIEAATITATARFAGLNDSPTVMISHHRDYDARSWTIVFSPPIKGFPTGDDYQDARSINQVVEAEICKRPEQYLWLHRRFKTRPKGKSPVYQ